MGFGVWGLGFGVWGLGFGVWGLDTHPFFLSFASSRLKTLSLSGTSFTLRGFSGLGLKVWGFGLRVNLDVEHLFVLRHVCLGAIRLDLEDRNLVWVESLGFISVFGLTHLVRTGSFPLQK